MIGNMRVLMTGSSIRAYITNENEIEIMDQIFLHKIDIDYSSH